MIIYSYFTPPGCNQQTHSRSIYFQEAIKTRCNYLYANYVASSSVAGITIFRCGELFLKEKDK